MVVPFAPIAVEIYVPSLLLLIPSARAVALLWCFGSESFISWKNAVSIFSRFSVSDIDCNFSVSFMHSPLMFWFSILIIPSAFLD